MERLIDSDNLRRLQAQAAELEQAAAAAAGNRAARWEETGARVNAQLLKGGRAGRREFCAWLKEGRRPTEAYCPAMQLAGRAAALGRGAAGLLHLPAGPVAGAGLWDGRFEEDFSEDYYTALTAWRVRGREAPNGPETAQSGPKAAPNGPADANEAGAAPSEILLPCASRQEFDARRRAFEEAGAACTAVCGKGQGLWPGALEAEEAARRYAGRAVGVAFADPICAPFLGALPKAVLWHMPPGEETPPWDCPEYRRLCARSAALADLGPHGGEGGAARFAALCAQHSALGRDLVVLATINYGFLRQRPQHLADLAARNGHRVFFVNPDAAGEAPAQLLRRGRLRVLQMAARQGEGVAFSGIGQPPCEAKDRHVLAQLKAMLAGYAVERPIVKVEHPLWASAALALQAEGAALVFDYLDDYAGFPHENAEWVKEGCEQLIARAEAAVASSAWLHRQIAGARRRCLIRNGAEAAHFAAAPRTRENARPVIGYYGVLSDWFDYDKIIALDKSALDVEIYLAGVALPVARQKLAGCKKVRLEEELPYERLPELLTGFDLCLIPFSSRSPLVRATNPVKFYEYLAGGKKIVATRIPELLPYAGRYVLLEDDDEAFVRAVAACLEGRDGLAPKSERRAFARRNDWSRRAEAFEQVFARLEEAPKELSS